MKKLILLSIASLAVFYGYSQDTHRDISYAIRLQPYLCESDAILEITINPQEISVNTMDTYYKWLDVNTCDPGQATSDSFLNNNSLKWEGDGVISYLGNTVKVIPRSSGVYTVSWSITQHYPANNCQPARHVTQTYSGTTTRIIVVPIPKPPTISVTKPILRSGETTPIYFSGCQNTLYDNGYSINPLNGQPTNGNAEFSKICTTNGNPDFVSRVFAGNETAATNNGPGVATYYARCNDNGCIGTSIETARVISQYSTPNCGDPKMDEIDGYSKDGRVDYHDYKEETVVCNVSDGNPNCTQQQVFEFMKTRKDYTVFNASDEHVTDIFPIFRQTAKNQIQLIGADAVFHIPDTPVSNCETVNLIGPLSLAMNLLTLKATTIALPSPTPYSSMAVSAAILSQLSTQQTVVPIANPIAQFIDNRSFSVTNYTKAGHSLYPGKVVRTVVDDCGQIKIVTIGVGRNWTSDTAPYIATVFPLLASHAHDIASKIGKYMGDRNKVTGKALFKDVDNRFVTEFNNLPR